MTTREEILASAQRCLNAEPTASTTRIAEAAGIGRATLHRHFATRETLLLEIGTRSLDRWQSRLDAADVEAVAASGDPDRLRACIATLLRAFVSDSDDFGFALTDTHLAADPALQERADALFERELSVYVAAQRAGVARPDVPARWLGHAVYGLLVAAREALHRGDVARRDLPDLVVQTFFDGGGAR